MEDKETDGFTEHTENGDSWNTRNTKMYNRNIWNIGGGVQGTRRKSGVSGTQGKRRCVRGIHSKIRGFVKRVENRGCNWNLRKSRGVHRTHEKTVGARRSHTQNRGGRVKCVGKRRVVMECEENLGMYKIRGVYPELPGLYKKPF